ncbi:MAG: hypothetical protein K8J31_11160 [Anaerolineae bacterium]|nr:hypothetical protein [Anaerolineae bacterium]
METRGYSVQPFHSGNSLRVAVLRALSDAPDGLSIREILALPALTLLVKVYGNQAIRQTVYSLNAAGLTFITPGTITARHFITALGRQVLPLYQAEL